MGSSAPRPKSRKTRCRNHFLWLSLWLSYCMGEYNRLTIRRYNFNCCTLTPKMVCVVRFRSRRGGPLGPEACRNKNIIISRTARCGEAFALMGEETPFPIRRVQVSAAQPGTGCCVLAAKPRDRTFPRSSERSASTVTPGLTRRNRSRVFGAVLWRPDAESPTTPTGAYR